MTYKNKNQRRPTGPNRPTIPRQLATPRDISRHLETSSQLALFDGDRYSRIPLIAQVARIAGYAEYLASDWWQHRRTEYLADHPRCELCGSRSRLEVHHVYYGRLGAELDEDLIVLCSRCHSRHHGTTRPRDNRP